MIIVFINNIFGVVVGAVNIGLYISTKNRIYLTDVKS